MNSTVIETKTFEETRKVGQDLVKDLKSNVLCLYGDLGYGKTTFVQGLAKGLGVEKKILSPTFIIMRSYKIVNKNFYHVDLYRIGSEAEIVDLGLPELMNGINNIVAIEWPEKLGSLLPKNRVDVRFEYLDEDKRKIIINDYIT